MSWLFGIFHKDKIKNINFELGEICQKYTSNKFQLFVGGNLNSSIIKIHQNKAIGFVGIALKNINETIKILNHEHICYNEFKIENFSGHFVTVLYDNEKLLIQNDVFGLRDLYYFENSELLIFSTRFDLLSKFQKNITIDFFNFGSLWYTNFQLSNKSILSNIQRLGPNGRIIFDTKTEIKNNSFKKTFVVDAERKFINSLSKFCNPGNLDKKISLALSGGIDSRIVLSDLIKNQTKYSCHTLINEAEKDLDIAKELASLKQIPHKLLPRKVLNLPDIVYEVENIYKNIIPSIPFTQLLDFVFYGRDYLVNKIIIDGGFGGFYRRQYFKKLFINGVSLFKTQNTYKIRDYLYSPKPKIFREDVNIEMEKGILNDLKNMVANYHVPQNKEELSEILDYISIQFVLPGIYGPGQTVVDQYLISFMPLVQSEIINLGMNIKVNKKNDSKFFKEIIKLNDNSLTKVNLVNNNLNFPFKLNYKLAMIKLILSRKFSPNENYSRYNVLLNSKNYILDLVNSKDLKENSFLDYSIISNNIAEFYNGNIKLGNFVDWFLTFILWCKANNIR